MMSFLCYLFFFFFKQKTAYDMRISDWSSDVCSSDLLDGRLGRARLCGRRNAVRVAAVAGCAGVLQDIHLAHRAVLDRLRPHPAAGRGGRRLPRQAAAARGTGLESLCRQRGAAGAGGDAGVGASTTAGATRTLIFGRRGLAIGGETSPPPPRNGHEPPPGPVPPSHSFGH